MLQGTWLLKPPYMLPIHWSVAVLAIVILSAEVCQGSICVDCNVPKRVQPEYCQQPPRFQVLVAY